MIKLLTSPWVSVPLGALLYLGSMILFWKTPAPPVREQDNLKLAARGPSWDFNNPEADQLITELKAEKGAQALRKQQLDDLRKTLDTERQEVAAAEQTVRQLQAEFDKSVVRIQEEELPNLKKMAKVYADMTPESAATVLGQLDDATMVKIMFFMKETETAAILEILAKKGPAEAKRAAVISDHIRLSITHKALPAK